MELLDDKIPMDSTSKDDVKEKFRLKQEYSAIKKNVKNARIVVGIIAIFSAVSVIAVVSLTNDPFAIGFTLGLAAIFGICAIIPLPNARFSLLVALILYSVNLIFSLFNPSALMIFGLIIKGIFIYFIVKGLIDAFKSKAVLEKMNRLNISPYRD